MITLLLMFTNLKKISGGHLKLKLIFKHGLDGSKSHPIFKQFMDPERKQGALLATTFVALQLTAEVFGNSVLIYENPRLASAYGCRPLRFWFVEEKETTAKSEIARLKSEAAQLVEFEWAPGIVISFKSIFSMNDTKIMNFVWEIRSAKRCFLCGATSIQFNTYMVFQADLEKLGDHCMSILHYLLRVFENIFNVEIRFCSP